MSDALRVDMECTTQIFQESLLWWVQVADSLQQPQIWNHNSIHTKVPLPTGSS